MTIQVSELEAIRKRARQVAGKGRQHDGDTWLAYAPIGEGLVRRRDITTALRVLRKRPGLTAKVVPAQFVLFRWDGGELRLLIHQPHELGQWKRADVASELTA